MGGGWRRFGVARGACQALTVAGRAVGGGLALALSERGRDRTGSTGRG